MKRKTIKRNFSNTDNFILSNLNNHIINMDKFNKNKKQLAKKFNQSVAILEFFVKVTNSLSSVQLAELFEIFDNELVLNMLDLDNVPKWLDEKYSNTASCDKYIIQKDEHFFKNKENDELINLFQLDKSYVNNLVQREVASLSKIKEIVTKVAKDKDEEVISHYSKIIWSCEPTVQGTKLYFGEYVLAATKRGLTNYEAIVVDGVKIFHSHNAEVFDFNKALLPNGLTGGKYE